MSQYVTAISFQSNQLHTIEYLIATYNFIEINKLSLSNDEWLGSRYSIFNNL